MPSRRNLLAGLPFAGSALALAACGMSTTNLAEALARVSAMTRSFQQAAGAGPPPVLATPEQIYAEQLTLTLLHDPSVEAARAAVLCELRTHPNSRSVDGAATLDRAVLLWTTTFIMQKINERISPAFLVYADDTPHTWFGQTFPGVGVSGDNPDNIYRVAEFDGAHRYEVHGRMPANPPAQITINLAHAMSGGGTASATTTDLGTHIKLFKDEDLDIGPDGAFTITVGPTDAPGNHMTSRPGRLELWVRESKSDWRQATVRLSIRCLDGPDRPAPTIADIAADVAHGLGGWCNRWATFRMNYLGRPPVNTISPPLGRDGTWGELAGGRWELGTDDAIVAVLDPQSARYFGLMLTDPWGITLDARTTISSRNNHQTTLNADGTATYVICARDPGVANWIATSGLTQGEMRFRWQRLPQPFDSAVAIRLYRSCAYADLAAELPDLVGRISAASRHDELQTRARDYDTRWTT